MLRRDAAAELDRVAKDPRRRPADERSLLVGEDQGQVQVAVPRVPDGADPDARLLGEQAHPPQHLRDGSDGDRDVLGEVVVRRRPHDLTEAPPSLPEPVPLGRRLRDAVVHPVQHLDHPQEVRLDVLVRRAVGDDHHPIRPTRHPHREPQPRPPPQFRICY